MRAWRSETGAAPPGQRTGPPADVVRGSAGRSVEADGSRGGGMERILIFTLDRQEFGIPLNAVVEIIRYRPPTPVPGTHESIEGVLPFRGRMATLLCARRRLSLPERPAGLSARVIMLEDRGDLIGLIVDSVARVAAAGTPDRQALPASLGVMEARLYAGALRGEGRFVLLLDLNTFLDHTWEAA